MVENRKGTSRKEDFSFSVTGIAAHGRIAPLVPAAWDNLSPYNKASGRPLLETSGSRGNQKAPKSQKIPDFLWENAPRRDTKDFRDRVACYNHLPNGRDILDSKWVLARLLTQQEQDEHENKDGARHDNNLTTCETHCFRGMLGFQAFARHVDLKGRDQSTATTTSTTTTTEEGFPDLLDPTTDLFHDPKDEKTHRDSATPPDLWVVKDAGSNGAGGIWVVGPENLEEFSDTDTTPLLPEHKYVAQRYVWPMVLYGGRKCHVRVYVLITSDGRAFVHRNCFLHVANEPFVVVNKSNSDSKGDERDNDQSAYQDSVHITNCCANSHDDAKFAGEICADLLMKRQEQQIRGDNNVHDPSEPIGLGEFFPSIKASVLTLTRQSLPFLDGGQGNGGFEYLGLDFILSTAGNSGKPCAYLLEVNAPPSQDTATGLPHAEALHDTVLRDLITLWVLPRVMEQHKEVAGGWQCVHNQTTSNKRDYNPSSNKETTKSSPLTPPLPKVSVPSKAAVLNKMRWALVERKFLRRDSERYGAAKAKSAMHVSANQSRTEGNITNDTVNKWAIRAREYFPYFAQNCGSVFLESAGGSQVPRHVIWRVNASLEHRHRSIVGLESKNRARRALYEWTGASPKTFSLFLGSNASSLFAMLALQVQNHLLQAHSQPVEKPMEIILSIENHLANVKPWLDLAHNLGAIVKWWDNTGIDRSPTDDAERCSTDLTQLVTERTIIVATSHASNVLGQVRDLRGASQTVRRYSKGRALLVVDGVATMPHVHCTEVFEWIDVFAISCHKVFGPHLGAIFCRSPSEGLPSWLPKLELDVGTVSYEACEGVVGSVEYLKEWCEECLESDTNVPVTIERCYDLIRQIEIPLCEQLVKGLEESSQVRTASRRCRNGSGDLTTEGWVSHLPVVAMYHKRLSSGFIEKACREKGFLCRSGSFLSTEHLLDSFAHERRQNAEVDGRDRDMVRFSLAHYNTQEEIVALLSFLSTLKGWK